METSMIRMKANLIDINKIEVKLSKNYYSGISAKFYLRNLTTYEVSELQIANKNEDEKYINYYFENVTLDLANNYQVIDAYGLSETLQYTKLVKLTNFDQLFNYNGNDLGTIYYPDHTIFKVWAPTALSIMVRINKDGYSLTHLMKRIDNGVFFADIIGDYNNCSYNYLVKHHESYIETTDPYAYSSIANGLASVIINRNCLDQDLNRYYLKPMNKKTEAIIYELSVRDFTIHPSIASKNKGKFIGVIEHDLKTSKGDLAGIDYLIDLGITHVQLLPIYDFATVDENHPELFYNWGYDPSQYNVPEGSYASNPNDGYSRIIECQEMVSKLHEAGIRVVMDVVYNHMYDINASSFERVVPGYYFRRKIDGSLSNGSWCGNDLNTTASMVRKYIIDMCSRWQKLYGIDGYRFDLMGIIDIDTINQVFETCHQIDNSFMVYGEGWNMDTALDNSLKAMQDNHDKLKNIGFFNDGFRDVLKGSNNMHDKGYLLGELYHIGNASNYLKNTNRYSRVDQSINYFECHDNPTMYDKIIISNNYEDEETRNKRLLLMNMTCILAQGIPFIHSGQEFFRTKKGIENSYNSPDEINALDWDLKDKNIKYVEELKKIIKVRQDNDCFKYTTIDEVNKYIDVECVADKMLKYTLRQDNGCFKEIIIYLNASNVKIETNLEINRYEFIYGEININEKLEIEPISMLILGVR